VNPPSARDGDRIAELLAGVLPALRGIATIGIGEPRPSGLLDQARARILGEELAGAEEARAERQ